MKKQVMAVFVLVLLLNSLFAVAQLDSSSPSPAPDCNWWCKVKEFFSGGLVGKAGAVGTVCAKDTDCAGNSICVDSKCTSPVDTTYSPSNTFTSKLSELKSMINNNANLKANLVNEKIDISKLEIGDKTEIIKVQNLIGATDDGLFGTDSLNRLNTYVKTLSPVAPEPTPTQQPVTQTTTTAKKPDYTPEQLHNVISANSLRAINNGFTGDPETSGAAFEPGGVTTYKKGDSYVHVYSDGRYSLVGQKDGKTVYDVTFDGAGNIVLAPKLDLNGVTGKYSDNQQLVDDLYNFGVITNNQYQDIKGTGVALEKDMAFVQKTIEGNLKQGAATQPSQTVTVAGKEYSNIEDVQTALKDGKITHGQAYDAMKIIADNDAAKAKQSDDRYKTLLDDINNLDIKLKDGKIPASTPPEDVSKIGIPLGITPTSTTTFIPPQRISDFTTDDIVQIGKDTYKVGFVGKNRIEFYPESKDQTSVITYNSEAEFQKGVKATPINIIRTTGESEADYLKRVNAALEAKKKEHDDKQATSTTSKTATESVRWQGTWWDVVDKSPGYKAVKDVGSVLTGGFELVGSLGSYRALSNLLFPDTTKAWSSWANSETLTRWADLPNFAAAKACGESDAKSANQPGQSAAFITTIAGTHQAVGSVQAEKSPTKFPLLCRKNKADQWVCPKDLVCKDNIYCYKDKNSEKPEEGYFYKITWGVTAPSDEKFTPYVDEDGVAAKFNVYLDDQALYVKKGVTEKKQVLQLTNGGHDGGMIVRYLPKDYNSVCIIFDKPIKDRDGDDVDKICASIISSTGGVVEYASSSKAETVTSTSADVELDI